MSELSDDIDTMYVFMVGFDDTYPLDVVNSLFAEAQATSFKKYDEPRTVNFHVTTEESLSDDMKELASTWGEGDHFDLAVLVVHAHETRLNITEPCYGYSAAYEALRTCTGDRVVVILGGDSNPLQPGALRSDWVQKKIGRQFEDEYMDGKKGLLLSWDHKYQQSHVDALRSFALPSYSSIHDTNDDSRRVREWKITNLIHDDGPKSRDDVKSREIDSDSDDDEPSANVTETTAEISAPPSGRDTASDDLSDIAERDSDSSLSAASDKAKSTASEAEDKKSRESIPFMDDKNDGTSSSDDSNSSPKPVEAATLPLVRTFSNEARGTPIATEEKLSSDEEEHRAHMNHPPPPPYEESSAPIYPTVDVAKEALLEEPAKPDDNSQPADELPEKKPLPSGGVGDESPDENTDEKEDHNENTCLFELDTKPPLPTSDDDVIVEQPSSTKDADDWHYVSRGGNKDQSGGDACCLCFGGCWSSADSVTDEAMIA